jgi:acyl carrier protein
MTNDEIKSHVHEFIQKNFLFDAKRVVGEDESLLGSGIVDSTGVLELVGFLEEKFNTKFKDEELIGENFDSIAKIASFIIRKKSL